jgi:hypothetical protein
MVKASDRSDGRVRWPWHQPIGPTVVFSSPLASNLILLSPFSTRFSTATSQSCSTMTVLHSDAIVGFLGRPRQRLPESVIRTVGSARGQPLPHRAPLASPQLPPCPVHSKGAVSPDRSANDAKLHHWAWWNEGWLLALAIAPSRPLASPPLPPAQFAPRLRCPLAGPPTTRSSIARFEEMEGGFAPAAALDNHRFPLAGHSTPQASSTPMNFTHRWASISSKQQRDVALKAHVASVRFKCCRCFRGMFQVFHMDVAKVD